EDEARKAAIAHQREHVDAVSDPAALHQQRRALIAERSAGHETDAFLFGRQYDVMDVRVIDAQRDKAAVPGIRYVTYLPDADPLELRINQVRPIQRGFRPVVQGLSSALHDGVKGIVEHSYNRKQRSRNYALR